MNRITVLLPRILGIVNLLLCALTISFIAYLFALALPKSFMSCGGLKGVTISLASLAPLFHIISVWYLRSAILENRWPWTPVPSKTSSSSSASTPLTSAVFTPSSGSLNSSGTKHGEEEGSLLHNEGGDETVVVSKSAFPTSSSTPSARPRTPCEAAVLRWLPSPRTVFFTFCTILVIATYAVVSIAIWLRGATLPDLTTSQSLSGSGLSATVNLYREPGTALLHISATTELDAFFAQGFAHAQSRLWQLEFQRRVGHGRLSELVGEAGLATDKATRTLGVGPAAARSVEEVSPTSLAVLEAYTAGVNAYIGGVNSGKQAIPVEYVLLGFDSVEPWNITDSLVWVKLMSYSLSGNMDREVTRYKLATMRNLTYSRIQQLFPPFDVTRFPTVLSQAAIDPPYGPGPPVTEQGGRRMKEANADMDMDTEATATSESEALEALLQKGRDAVQMALQTASSSSSSHSVENSNAPSPPSSSWSLIGLSSHLASLLGISSSSSSRSSTTDADLPSLLGGNSKRGYSGVLNFAPRMGGLAASNDWVVGGSRTASGFPLLNNDPHLDLTAPSVWFLNHLAASSTGLNVIGASFVGVPGVVLGHNDHISWGVTNTGADCQDLYIMEEAAGDTTAYMYQGSYRPYTVSTQVIQVKGAGSVKINVRTSVHGNVVTDNGLIKGLGPATLSLRWTSTDPTIPDTTLDAFLGLQRASNWTDFRAALSSYIAPSQNFIYADTAGHIGYTMSGYIPSRNLAGGYSGAWPVNGSGVALYTWGPRITYASMPFTYDPPEGFVASANNQVVPPAYAGFISADWDEGSDGYRAQRITEVVSNPPAGGTGAGHTLASMAALQNDVTSNLAKDIGVLIGAVTDTQLSTSGGKALRDLLGGVGGWDNTLRVDSSIATQWAKVWSQLTTLGSEDVGSSTWGDMVYTWNALRSDTHSPNGTDPSCIAKGFSTCAAFLASVLDTVGSIPGSTPLWGSGVHQLNIQHQVLSGSMVECLSDRWVSHGGDGATVNVGGFDPSDASMTQTAGPSFRQIADLSNLDQSLYIMPMGEMGNFLSTDYDSLLGTWVGGEYQTMVRTVSSAGSLGWKTQTLVP